MDVHSGFLEKSSLGYLLWFLEDLRSHSWLSKVFFTWVLAQRLAWYLGQIFTQFVEESSFGLSGRFSALGDSLGDYLVLSDGFSLKVTEGYLFWLSDFHSSSCLSFKYPHWVTHLGYCKVFNLGPLLGFRVLRFLGSWFLGFLAGFFTQIISIGSIFHLGSCSSLGMNFNRLLALVLGRFFPLACMAFLAGSSIGSLVENYLGTCSGSPKDYHSCSRKDYYLRSCSLLRKGFT
jgi:hypothetical protein